MSQDNIHTHISKLTGASESIVFYFIFLLTSFFKCLIIFEINKEGREKERERERERESEQVWGKGRDRRRHRIRSRLQAPSCQHGAGRGVGNSWGSNHETMSQSKPLNQLRRVRALVHVADFLLGPHMVEWARLFCRVAFIRTRFSIMRALSS